MERCRITLSKILSWGLPFRIGREAEQVSLGRIEWGIRKAHLLIRGPLYLGYVGALTTLFEVVTI